MLVIPPNTLRVNEKYVREYYIFNVFGMVITSNYREALVQGRRRHQACRRLSLSVRPVWI